MAGIHRLLVQLIKRHSAIVWFLLILVAASVNVLYFKGITLRRSIFVTLRDNKKPLCLHGVLNRERRPEEAVPVLLTDGEDPYQTNRDCRLHHYDINDVVTCIDKLSYLRAQHKQPVHIAFIGESILRHQFTNFLRLIPEYDLKMKGAPTPKARYFFHEDRNVTSELLNFRLAFYWREVANEELVNTFGQWNTPPYDSTPDFVIVGMVFNHMSERHGNDYQLFSKGLTQLKPILKELSVVTRIVWMLQAPIVDASNTIHYTDTYLAKLPHYNAGVRTILKDSGVEIWDSVDPVALQYVRSCFIFERTDPRLWHNCFDSLHTGYVTLEHSSQILLNDICNRLIQIPRNENIHF